MSRSNKKGIFINHKLLKKIIKQRESNSNVPIKTWARGSMIIPEMINMKFLVHNGRYHIPVLITEAMIGHKLGEFAATRTYKGHTSLNKKLKRKK